MINPSAIDLKSLPWLLPVLTAISDRDWVRFKELEVSFALHSRDRNLGRCFQLENHAHVRTRG
ncbi:hypothetical protein [Nostoc sp. 'Peltigera membranacea cyanobiont' 232]|uniref:hypothetical protein n=1 Tax=Nostoc sp. 'Peltigera membranacea cyanobiont' 232 TaxID=2014531 RepID=UPI001CB979DE|nr:hypothetical protein [Nostoc sp. 'Peltigera membranacea cyanobiont' 232]